MFPTLLLLSLIPGADEFLANGDRLAAAPVLAAQIDALTEKHWQASSVRPAALADDSQFLRRLTLDLAGRIPTYREALAFARDRSPDKRARAIRDRMSGPEYALHLSRILDDMIQEKHAGDADFLTYLRTAVAEHKPWDQIFRDVLLGPWDSPERKRADRFLVRRLNSLDDLTNDTARIFFGVNVSCAKCHDHPLVPDWSQDHYYGMASFFHPTYEGSKGKRGAGVLEKATAEMVFVTTKGERRTAKPMFLSGRVASELEPANGRASLSRREVLVQTALEERTFFSRAVVNRLWAYLMGRGLVQPVDQMHSENPPAIPGLLEWLAEDLAAHGYDLDRLVAGLVSSRAYQLASARSGEGEEASDRHFARALLRPLTPHQYALSILLATGDDTFDQAREPEARGRRYRDLEGQVAALTRPGVLDPRTDRFQSSTAEALFMSNNAEVQRLVLPAGNNLAARLAAIADTRQLVETAVWAVLSRPAGDEEREFLTRWVDGRPQDRAKACGQLIWALITSAEFRFNH
jgi:hypothetical protein